ncbi:SGNH/GDSL hydrolase family protein [Nonomuraea sp. KC401]|uniref:SGNH/GDSL hydrolase family protein n=1 Tax=unclassified Nonomuraea TaxID=2593643 RepID=UPI0010FDE7A5|nr:MULTISPECIES: SGNH/GDSL hydrolase family protein [unclassified Nonomuraea]NBF00133.1 SGNH/GDSL hydrolase family protein [Nonomuraea sp. K271]TLF50521.1 SGNH/GDSL hydrolase family protein [Nonomuraea sp. KC401]
MQEWSLGEDTLDETKRRIARIVTAAALGVALALACLRLGALEKLACSVGDAGCPTTGEPGGRLPQVTRLTPVEVAQSGAYVALGDSFSSGEGVYDLDDQPVNDGADRCHRATGSYVPLVAQAYRFNGGTEFFACSGATTADLLAGQHGRPPQVGRAGPRTSLVTLSIGGNDAGFTKVLTGCIVKLPGSSACVEQEAAVERRIEELRSSVLTVLKELRVRAPGARVIVLGYPRPFPANPVESVDNLSPQDQRWLNGMTRRLNDTVGAVAAGFDRMLDSFEAPGSVEYVDAYDAFTGHEVGRPEPYLNGLHVDMGDLQVNARSYHPTGAGYRRFADLVTRQIAKGPGRTMHNIRVSTP